MSYPQGFSFEDIGAFCVEFHEVIRKMRCIYDRLLLHSEQVVHFWPVMFVHFILVFGTVVFAAASIGCEIFYTYAMAHDVLAKRNFAPKITVKRGFFNREK